MTKDVKQHYTVADIRAANTGHFFDKKTMNMFGDTMDGFGVKNTATGTYLYRKPRVCNDSKRNPAIWRFVPETGDLRPCGHDEYADLYLVLYKSASPAKNYNPCRSCQPKCCDICAWSESIDTIAALRDALDRFVKADLEYHGSFTSNNLDKRKKRLSELFEARQNARRVLGEVK